MRATLATLVVALCVGGEAPAAPAQEPDPIKPCDPAEVRTLVRRFAAAFNAGNLRQLDRIFAREPYFRWYAADGPGQHFRPIRVNRTSLLHYFARRHALGERLKLVSLRVNGNTVASGHRWKTYGNFDMRLVRGARDMTPITYVGKGALHCYRTRPDELILWSMGRDG